MQLRTRRTALTLLAAGLFGFAASLTASAQNDPCERCRQEWQRCMDLASDGSEQHRCDQHYFECTHAIDCPDPGSR